MAPPTVETDPVSLAYRKALGDALSMARRGMTAEALLGALRASNAEGRYDPTLSDSELEACVDNARKPRVERLIVTEGQPVALSVYTSSPPVWTLSWTDGSSVRLSSTELLSWPKIAVAFLDQRFAEVDWHPSREKWDEVRKELMSRCEKEEAGEELTLIGTVLEFLRALTGRAINDSDALNRGGVARDDDDYLIKASTLVTAIETGPAGSSYRFRHGFTARAVTAAMKSSLGATRAVIRVDGKNTRIWRVPIASLEAR